MKNGNCYAYVAIKTEPRVTQDLCRKLRDQKFVKECHAISGRYDVILRLETANQDELNTFILNDVRGHQGIVATETWQALN